VLNRLYAKILRMHLFSIFTIKTPQALAALGPSGLLILETLTNVLLLLQTTKPCCLNALLCLKNMPHLVCVIHPRYGNAC